MIAWEEAGSGPPLVLVHGLTEDRRVWDPVVPPLADHHRCIRLDLRGHGESSDAADYSPLLMADDIAEVIEKAGVDEPPVIVGHSLGAAAATFYATRAPVSGVVNIDQPMRLGDFARALAPLADGLRGPAFHETLAIVFAALGAAELPEPSRTYVEAKHRAARQDVVLGVWSLVFDSDPDELTELAATTLRSVSAPYLVIHGTDPGEDYVMWLRSVMPQVALEAWGIDGHYPHLVEPDRFVATIRRFAADVQS